MDLRTRGIIGERETQGGLQQAGKQAGGRASRQTGRIREDTDDFPGDHVYLLILRRQRSSPSRCYFLRLLSSIFPPPSVSYILDDIVTRSSAPSVHRCSAISSTVQANFDNRRSRTEGPEEGGDSLLVKKRKFCSERAVQHTSYRLTPINK